MARLVLAVAALAFLAFGLACLIAPTPVFASFGLPVGPDPWTTELRAFYGGLEIGLGLLLGRCALREDWQSFGLWLVICAYGGIGLARLVAMVVDGEFGTQLWGAAALELAFAAVAFIALRLRR